LLKVRFFGRVEVLRISADIMGAELHTAHTAQRPPAPPS
jgi:hypothetical protein